MMIAIISDLHDNLVNLEKCLNWCHQQSIKHLICLGDVTNSESLATLYQNFPGKIFLIQGNAEIYQTEELKNFPRITDCGRYGKMEINNLKIGLVHEPFFINQLLQENKNIKFDFIFHGHTHKPWLEEKNNIKIANPGTLGGVFMTASFAVLNSETKKLDLKILSEI